MSVWDIEGKYTLADGSTVEAHLNVAVKMESADGSFKFRRYSISEFLGELEIAKSHGAVTFEPKERKVDE